MDVVETEVRKSVLVVDDNPLIRNVVQSLLQQENFDVTVAPNGNRALEIIEHKPVDIIVCDVMMPDMDGYELFDAVRENQLHSHIPFVFLTALDTESELKRGYQSGCDAYVTKPFDPEMLISTIRGKVLRSADLKRSLEHQSDRFRKRVLHTLSHEFRTPLVAINTGSEMLLDGISSNSEEENEKSRKLIEAIHRGGQRLERLVNDFMILQQIEAGVAAGVQSKRARMHSVRSLVDCAVESMEQIATEQGAEIICTVTCQGAQVKVCDVQIIEVLKRLIENSIKFSHDKKLVEIVAVRDNNEIRISVADSGIGFDPVKMQSSLGVFNQIDREKHEQQGGGLGLAIASRYVDLNGGSLSFSARSHGGAVVTIHLPVGHCGAS